MAEVVAEAPEAEVLVGGSWRPSSGSEQFWSFDPSTGDRLEAFPVSLWPDAAAALAAGAEAFPVLQEAGPEAWGEMLERFADAIAEHWDELISVAHLETALPKEPRLGSVELPRTIDQLRGAARVARSRVWREPVLEPEQRIASFMAPIPGVVAVFGPNNFPFAFNSVAGGDFAAAIATGHPVLAKANPGHPATTRLLAQLASRVAQQSGLPPATVQMLYHLAPDDGLRLVADPAIAATAFTGSRRGGLALKAAADAAGRPIYLEMSSVNPVVVLPGACDERGPEIAGELADSMALATGQFCTSPGMIFTVGGQQGDEFRDALIERLATKDPGPLLAPGVAQGLQEAVGALQEAGATVIWKSEQGGTGAWSQPTTLLAVDGTTFLGSSAALQQEAFGNAAVIVSVADIDELVSCLRRIEGNLTGTIYASDSQDAAVYTRAAEVLRPLVGRLVKDKPPTGVAVVAAMNHGGPFPATGHPGFTAVGMPASLRRFTMLQSFDNVDDPHLPPELQAANPLGLPRFVHGRWSDEAVTWSS